MQSGIPSLPVVCSDKHSCSSSKYSGSLSGTPRKSKLPLSATRLLKRKPFNDVYGVNSSYRNTARFYPLAQASKSSKNQVSQRILSAKMLRVKQLQNQLTDAHYHLNELSNENKLLKAIQKKQESALRKYEGTNAELPRIINSHHEDLRVLQAKYKKLKEQHKITCDNLKEKEKELHSLQVFNKKLLQLSQNRNLLERDKLQSQVSDLTYQMEQQQITIQNLNKKLSLETKSLKQQVHSEVMKHKETQKNLQDTLEKLKSLEDMLDNREKRLYYNNQLPVFNKTRSIAGNCSFSSLEDSGVSLNYSKSSIKKIDNDLNDKILPSLSDLDMNFERKMNGKSHDNQLLFLPPGQKFRLSKSASRSISAKSTDPSEKSVSSGTLKKVIDEDDLTLSPQEIDKLDLNNKEDDEKCHKLDSIDYNNLPQLSDLQDFVDETDLKHEELFRKSRQVCARLTSEQSPLISSRTMTIANHRGNYEEIERMVQEEFDKGQNYALSVLQSGPEKTFIQDEKTTDDIKNQDDTLFVKEPKPDMIATNSKESIKTPEKKESPKTPKDEEIEEQVSNSTDIPETKGSETFRQSSNDDLEHFFDKLVLKNGSFDGDEVEDGDKFSTKEKERLNLYLESEEKSEGKVRKNSRDSKNEKKSESDKKEMKKIAAKNFDKEKLLAEMKAIDNNDNIEYYDQKSRKNSGNDRSKITENLYRGIPTQRRNEAMASTILNTKLDTKLKSNGMKFH